MKKSTLITLMLSVAPLAVHAESITGGVTLSYTQHSNGGNSIDTGGIDGRLALEMDNGLSLEFNAGHSTMSQSGSPFDLNAEFYSIEGGYMIGSGTTAGVFMDRLTLGADNVPVTFNINTNGLFVSHQGAAYDAEVFYGVTDSTMFMIPAGLDITNYGVIAHYTGYEGLNLGGTFSRAHISGLGGSGDLDFVGVGATYLVNNSLMVFGGASSLDMNVGGDGIDAFGLGLSYDLGAQMGFASSVSFEYGQTSMGGDGVDVIRVGLSIPLGKSGPVLPMNSVADAVLNPRHGAFVAGMTAGF